MTTRKSEKAPTREEIRKMHRERGRADSLAMKKAYGKNGTERRKNAKKK